MKPPPAAALPPELIAARSGSNFLVGIRSLPPASRAAMTGVYSFCRVVDDAVDDTKDLEEGRAWLQFWRAELDAAVAGQPQTPVGQAVQRALRQFGVDARHLYEVIEGMAMDLQPQAFDGLPALEVYCHRVASAVGLACLPIMGAHSAASVRFADRLGQALQLTNILRDLRSDAQEGRVYVPRRWLVDCRVDPAWLAGGGPAEAYRPGGPVARLCARLAAVARARFQEARAALQAMPAQEQKRVLPARIMGAVYGELLLRLVHRGGELRGPRVRVPKAKKLWLVAKLKLGLQA